MRQSVEVPTKPGLFALTTLLRLRTANVYAVNSPTRPRSSTRCTAATSRGQTAEMMPPEERAASVEPITLNLTAAKPTREAAPSEEGTTQSTQWTSVDQRPGAMTIIVGRKSVGRGVVAMRPTQSWCALQRRFCARALKFPFA